MVGGLALAIPVVIYLIATSEKKEEKPRRKAPIDPAAEAVPLSQPKQTPPARSSQPAPPPTAAAVVDAPLGSVNPLTPAEPEPLAEAVEEAVGVPAPLVQEVGESLIIPAEVAAPVRTPRPETTVVPELSQPVAQALEAAVEVATGTPAEVEAYPEDIWAGTDRPSEENNVDRRRWVRPLALQPARIKTAREELRVDMIDISPAGARARAQGGHAASPFVVLEEVQVLFPEAPESVPAVIIWSFQNSDGYEEVGLRFEGAGSLAYRERITPLLRKAGWNDTHFKQRRHSRRLAQGIQIQVQDSKEKTWQGILVNIGLGGAAATVTPPHKVGAQLGLVIPAGKKGSTLHLPGVVLSVRDDVHHVKFLNMKAGLRKRLEAYLKSQEKI